jgi:hypothetical protein
VVFRNEEGNTEFAFQSERVAKNMTDIPHRRYAGIVLKPKVEKKSAD